MADFPQFIGPSYTSFSAKAEVERTMNLYLERIESGAGRNQFAMYMAPGTIPILAPVSGKKVSRGSLELNDHLFQVIDDTIVELVSGSGGITVNATFSPIFDDGSPVSIAASTNSLFVVSGTTLYRVNSAALTIPDIPVPFSAVAVLTDLIFGLAADGSRQIYFSSDDGVTWDALDFQTAEAGPNSLITMIVDHQELWVPGNRLTQVFVLSGDANAPLSPVSAGLIEMGIGGPRAIVALDNSLFGFGRNKDGEHIVWRANGYTPQRVSDHAFENAVRGYPRHDDVLMGTFQLNGHSCLRLTFPSANSGRGATWQYDVSVPAWTEVAFWDLFHGEYIRHRANTYVSAFGKIVVGDYANGWLYELTPDEPTDYGFPLHWERRAPHLTDDGKNVQYKRFGVFMQVGGSIKPQWLNNYGMTRSAFVTALAVAVGLEELSATQATAIQAIYDLQPHDPSVVLPDASVMTSLGFYDYGSNPHVSLRWSNNGGFTWTRPRDRSLGQVGDYKKRLFWTPCGMGRDRVWELSGYAPVKTAIVQAAQSTVQCLS